MHGAESRGDERCDHDVTEEHASHPPPPEEKTPDSAPARIKGLSIPRARYAPTVQPAQKRRASPSEYMAFERA